MRDDLKVIRALEARYGSLSGRYEYQMEGRFDMLTGKTTERETRVTELDLSSTGIEDLSPIASLTALTRLDLTDNHLGQTCW